MVATAAMVVMAVIDQATADTDTVHITDVIIIVIVDFTFKISIKWFLAVLAYYKAVKYLNM